MVDDLFYLVDVVWNISMAIGVWGCITFVYLYLRGANVLDK